MLNEISPQQFRRWKHYFELEPFGERLKDYRVAHVVQALFNIARDQKAHREPFPLKLFIPNFGDYGDLEPEAPPARQTWQEQKAWASLFTRAFNTKD